MAEEAILVPAMADVKPSTLLVAEERQTDRVSAAAD